MPTRRCALPASRRLDRGDVDLAHLHHGVEGAFGRGSVGAGEGLGQGAGRDLPRQAPLVLAPAAGTFLAAVVDDRVPQSSEEHTSERPSRMRIPYDAFCLSKHKYLE